LHSVYSSIVCPLEIRTEIASFVIQTFGSLSVLSQFLKILEFVNIVFKFYSPTKATQPTSCTMLGHRTLGSQVRTPVALDNVFPLYFLFQLYFKAIQIKVAQTYLCRGKKIQLLSASFEVAAMSSMNSSFFSSAMSCTLVEVYQHFETTYCLRL
jgi:hypothetical protein